MKSVLRFIGRAVAIVIAILVASLVASLTVDLGPAVRRLAEDAASREIMRPVRIGGLHINLLQGALFGQVEATDILVAGRSEADRPFFTAQRITASIDWFPAIARRPAITITSVEMSDWKLLVEKWRDGTNFPKRRPRQASPGGKRPFTVAMRYFRASRGEFVYDDHQDSWGIQAPNIRVDISNYPNYHGEVSTNGGLVTVQDHLPMWTNMKARFTINGNTLLLRKIDIESDGARATAYGSIDMARWPEQIYAVDSTVQFQRMREIFFTKQPWPLTGQGHFAGSFHLFKGGHELKGDFSSAEAGLYDYRFANLNGSLLWNDQRFDVWNAQSDLFGGKAGFEFSIAREAPSPRAPKTARFTASYADLDLAAFTDFQQLSGLKFGGLASGRNVIEWPMGHTDQRRGEGELVVAPPLGMTVMTDSLAAERAADPDHRLHEWGPFGPVELPEHLPVAAHLSYRFDAAAIELSGGRFATPKTHVAFEGSTAWLEESQIGFHVVSSDWQESQQVLAGILTDFGSRTGPIPFGGRGEFDGELTGRMRRPRVEGKFVGEDVRAWDTVWGDGSGHVVVENSYVDVSDGVVRKDGSEIRAEGRFSLGYPRRDGGQELDARFRVTDRDLESLRHAFQIDDYPVSGRLSGEFQLTGQYEHPIGFGAMTITPGVAYGESFEEGRATLRFDGNGVRLDAITVAKATGTMTGAAYVAWDSTYSFNADARLVPVAKLALFDYPAIAPAGTIDFTASGSGTFDAPRFDVRYRITDFSMAEESVGQVTGTLARRESEVTGDFDVVSPRLTVTGTGRIEIGPQAPAEITIRFHDSSLDPYVRLFVPRMSPFTTAVASGSIRVSGPLTNIDRLVVDGTVDKVDMQMFDYAIRNASPVRLALDHNVVRINDLELTGEDTRLRIDGTVGLSDQKVAIRAIGEANLGILQGFFRDVRGSGRAELAASINGDLKEPLFSGSATISNGRVRHSALPNSLDGINGTLRFDSRSVSLDDLTAIIGGGRVQFGGRVGFDGYLPGELSVTAFGEGMQVRYPEGVRSVIDADLLVRGNVKAPTVSGSVLVKSALWNKRIDPTGNLLDFGSSAAEAVAGPAQAPPIPVRLDVQVMVPSTLKIDNNIFRLVASADLQLRGTYDRPLLFGRADVDSGVVLLQGRRYQVTKGAVEFTNPSRIEPFVDVEAQTRVRVPGQTYQVVIRAAGTLDRLDARLESDPPLPEADVLALLFSDVRRNDTSGPGDAEIRALQNPNERETNLLTSAATQTLTNPISSEVGRVMERAFGVDAFQLTPSLIDPYAESTTLRVNPAARVTILKRLSERAYLTYSRSLSTSINDQILLLEYDESERFSWILSRNEDQTYALEFRVRHIF